MMVGCQKFRNIDIKLILRDGSGEKGEKEKLLKESNGQGWNEKESSGVVKVAVWR
jgi:hypothetical protein